MPNLEPSPRPWRVEENVVGWHSFIVDANGDGVAACWRTARGDDEKERQYNEANAALIVAAIDERDRLRDIVRRTVETLEQVYKHADMTDALREVVVETQREASAAIGDGAPTSPCAPAPAVVSSSANRTKP